MDKNEILKKSRESKNDEGMEYAENQGRKVGFIVFVVLFVFIVIFNQFFGETSTFHAVSSLFWAYLAAESYGKYRLLKSKMYLITAFAGSIAAFASIANYIFETLR